MAIRKTTHVLKNSSIVNRPLPSVIKAGEPIINTADGIMYFSGVTSSTNEWTPAGTGTTANFFEVGSNLYDLQLRNRITEYEGVSGAGLIGKFLSGTTNGFVLADISSISGVDSYVTGGTFNGGTSTLTLNLNEGKPSVNITGINDEYTTGSTLVGSTAYFDRTDTLSAYTLDLSTFISTGDTYTTGFTYDGSNNITIDRNQGLGSLSVNIDTMTGLTVNGTLLATTVSATTYQGLPTDVYVTGGTLTAGTVTYTNSTGGTFLVTGFTNDLDTYVTGGTVSIPATDNTNLATIGLFYKNSEGPHTLPFQNTYITGGTVSGTNLLIDKNDGTQEVIDLSSLDDSTVTAFTYDNANEFTIFNSDGSELTARIDTVTGMTNTGNLDLQGELANSTGNVVINDNLDITGTTTSWGNILPGTHLTYDLGVQGQRWDNLWVKKINIGTSTTTLEDDGANFTVSGSNGNFILQPFADMVVHADLLPDVDLTRDLGASGTRWNELHAGGINATGLTVSNLTAGRVVYVGTGGLLTDEAGFTYNDSTNTLSTPVDGTMNVGTGGLNVGGDTVIQGSLTVFGPSVSAFTNELYVEDPQITLNYNPTGSTVSTSIGAGWLIQDGNGVVSGDVNLDIRRMDTLTGLTATEIPNITEYTSGVGYENRGWTTQLNDIVIRSTDVTIPNGVRVLAEFDCLDGGTY